MFEVKETTNRKVQIKGLTISEGQIVDEDGLIKDINRVIMAAFPDGAVFDFTVQNKSEEVNVIEEEENGDDEK